MRRQACPAAMAYFRGVRKGLWAVALVLVAFLAMQTEISNGNNLERPESQDLQHEAGSLSAQESGPGEPVPSVLETDRKVVGSSKPDNTCMCAIMSDSLNCSATQDVYLHMPALTPSYAG